MLVDTLLCKHLYIIKFLFNTKTRQEVNPNNKLINKHLKADFLTPLLLFKAISSEIILVVVILILRISQSNSK